MGCLIPVVQRARDVRDQRGLVSVDMETSQLWFTVLAIVASVLSAGGIVSQVIAWRREREKTRSAEVVELAKVGLDSEKHEREHTGQFQTRLMERITQLETNQDKTNDAFAELWKANLACEEANEKQLENYGTLLENYETAIAQNQVLIAQNEVLIEQNAALSHENVNLKTDIDMLKDHVSRIEQQNRIYRASPGFPPPSVVESETIEIGAREARRVTQQGE